MSTSVVMKDIAREAGVSIGTVSRVLNNHSNVNADIRQHVLRIAAEMGYFRPKSVVKRSGSSLQEIGFLLTLPGNGHEPSLVDPFWTHILHGAEMEASTIGAKVTYRNISALTTTPYDLLAHLHDMQLDGALLVGPASNELVRIIQLSNIPVVLVDNALPKLKVDAILGNNFEGAREIVTSLIDEGHRRILFIGGPTRPGPLVPFNEIYTIEWRARGYRTALQQAGIPLESELFESGDLSHESGYEICQRLLAASIPFTAVFAAIDNVAVGAMKALKEQGLRVPEDVSVVGFDDVPIASMVTPALTTVHVPKEAMGATAVRTLLERVSHPELPFRTITLQVEFIKRVSTAPCRNNLPT